MVAVLNQIKTDCSCVGVSEHGQWRVARIET